ncbi:hypothetical protein CH300_20060 [Rhodococcus sp. 15-1154-1]|nr:hypothetical protein [Rhodococcus sp. 15-1154-1]OZF00837.1 hypothetical protein CH300_20060 [Rhodococcus sp. 15-1154-1]
MEIGDRVRYTGNAADIPVAEGVITDVLELYPSNTVYSYNVVWDDGAPGACMPGDLELVHAPEKRCNCCGHMRMECDCIACDCFATLAAKPEETT